MKFIIVIAMLLQLAFDVATFQYIVHGEIAWRWQESQPPAFRNSSGEYPGYYCGHHDCTLGAAK